MNAVRWAAAELWRIGSQAEAGCSVRGGAEMALERRARIPHNSFKHRSIQQLTVPGAQPLRGGIRVSTERGRGVFES